MRKVERNTQTDWDNKKHRDKKQDERNAKRYIEKERKRKRETHIDRKITHIELKRKKLIKWNKYTVCFRVIATTQSRSERQKEREKKREKRKRERKKEREKKERERETERQRERQRDQKCHEEYGKRIQEINESKKVGFVSLEWFGTL